MTRLTKPVKRTTGWAAPYGVKPEVVITLYPGGRIGLRELGRRKEVQVSAAVIYTRALLAERQAAKKARRKGGRS